MTESLIAIIFGGQNTEYDVSCRSAASVLANLDRTRFRRPRTPWRRPANH
jgi:D-alanine-D-alanine ligase